jgi:toxin YoeB
MQIVLTSVAQEHLLFFKQSGNKKILAKITTLLDAISIEPFNGIGKPEQLKENYTGFWSRRINKEHRLIYTVTEDIITIYRMKGHYE